MLLRFLLLTFLIGVMACAVSPVRAQSSSVEAYFEFRDNHNSTFVFKLTDPATIQQARDILRTGAQKIANGIIIKQPVYYNPQWSFHYDPKALGFADATIEACQSTIQGIENNLDGALPYFCPTTTLIRELPPPPHPGGGNLSPTVSMTDPYANDTSSDYARASVILRANADDPDGTISKVEFFHDATKIGETSTAPYVITWNDLGSGTYSVSAVATDDQGVKRPSKSVRFTIVGLEDVYFFVNQQYRDFLNRWPEIDGLFFWTGNIYSCGADTACREAKRIDTSAAFFLSIEFQETGYLAHRFYKASFGRRPLFSEFLPDMQAIGNGVVVNASGWQQLLENNKQSFANAWVTRAAFSSIYDGLSNAQYVDTLIANTEATFTQTERNALIDVLNNQSMTRAQVLRLVAENQAFYNKEYNAAFVEMQYFGYLRRNPQDPPDNNLNGYNFWLNKLNEFGGDFRKADMVKSFLVSGEYRQRFGPP
jgi:hypothetical protein